MPSANASQTVRRGATYAWQRARAYASAPCPLPARPVERLLFGLTQPVFAFRLLADPAVLRAALAPALLLVVFCAVVGIVAAEDGSPGGMLRAFYHTFAVLAPVPSIVLTNHYARLAAAAHERLGLGPCLPRTQSIPAAALLALRMAAVVAVALAPLLFLLGKIPALGQVVVGVMAALWALYWIVVEALDSARVVLAAPDPTDAPPQAGGQRPWFVHLLAWPAHHLPVVGPLLRRFTALSHRLCRPWQEEIALCEAHPALFVGLSLSTALLLAMPVLNLLFRPIIIIASVHVLGQLRRAARTGAPGGQRQLSSCSTA